jgi:hypothetical protein
VKDGEGEGACLIHSFLLASTIKFVYTFVYFNIRRFFVTDSFIFKTSAVKSPTMKLESSFNLHISSKVIDV